MEKKKLKQVFEFISYMLDEDELTTKLETKEEKVTEETETTESTLKRAKEIMDKIEAKDKEDLVTMKKIKEELAKIRKINRIVDKAIESANLRHSLEDKIPEENSEITEENSEIPEENFKIPEPMTREIPKVDTKEDFVYVKNSCENLCEGQGHGPLNQCNCNENEECSNC